MHKKQVLFALILGLTVLLGWLATKSSAQPSPLWRFPLNSTPSLVRGFDPPLHNWLPGHRGVDLRAQSGQMVFAPANGLVVYVSNLAGRGVLVIKHGQLRTTYEPVVSGLTIGDQVYRGDLIGRVDCGSNHCCIGSSAKCLHWGLLRGHQYLNPLRKVDVHIRLLPIEPVLPQMPITKDSEANSGASIPNSATTKSASGTNHIRRTRPEGAPARKLSATDPSKRAYKVAWLPNWHGQVFLAQL